MFEQLSSLKINFHKREMFCFGHMKELEEDYKKLVGCKTGTLPLRYIEGIC